VTATGELAVEVDGDAPVVGASVGKSKRRRSRGWRTAWEYAVLIISALVLASLIRAFLGLAFWIPSESMLPTLQVGDRVVVSRLSYRMHQPNRGDIVVFQNPQWQPTAQPILPLRLVKDLGEFVGIGQPKEKNYIKRVIALPGERVKGENGHVFINNVQLAEPWLPSGMVTQDFAEVRVPAGKYWVMGDNRDNSCDSRCFTDPNNNPAPFIDEEKIVGRAFVRVWPVNRMGKP
jgi:signal peptidase I